MSIKLMSRVWELDLPQNETLVLLAMCDHANDDGLCYPSVRRVAWKTGYSKRSVQRILRKLESEQIVNVYREAPGKPGKPRVYQIVLGNACPKEPFMTDANLAPVEAENPGGGVTPVSQTGDIFGARGDTQGATGDIAVAPESSVEPSVESPLKQDLALTREENPLPCCPDCQTDLLPTAVKTQAVCPECNIVFKGLAS